MSCITKGRKGMGLFSQDCKVCERAILAPYITDERRAWMNEAVVFTPNGSRLIGTYDGYGRLLDGQLVPFVEDAIGLDGNAVYHRACWELAGRPDAYPGPSRSSANQGFFIDADDPEYDQPDPRTLRR